MEEKQSLRMRLEIIKLFFGCYMPQMKNVLKSGNTVCCINGDELFSVIVLSIPGRLL